MRALAVILALAVAAYAEDKPSQVHGLSRQNAKLELPGRWLRIPPALTEALQQHIKQRLSNGPFAKYAFDAAFIRGGSGDGFKLFGGEYLLVSFSSELITPETIASLSAQAGRLAGNEIGGAWNEMVGDLAWNKLTFDAKRGFIALPGKGRGADGADVRITAYLVPTKGDWILLIASGGAKEPDTVFAEVEAAIAKRLTPPEFVIDHSWWEALAKAMAAQKSSPAHP